MRWADFPSEFWSTSGWIADETETNRTPRADAREAKSQPVHGATLSYRATILAGYSIGSPKPDGLFAWLFPLKRSSSDSSTAA